MTKRHGVELSKVVLFYEKNLTLVSSHSYQSKREFPVEREQLSAKAITG